jgi:hypothetical protein
MKTLPVVLVMFTSASCKHMGGLGSFHAPAPSFHTAVPVPHASPSSGGSANLRSAPAAEHGSGPHLRVNPPDVLVVAGVPSADYDFDDETPTAPLASAPETAEEPSSEPRWAPTVDVVSDVGSCSALTSAPLNDTVLHRNTSVTLFIQSPNAKLADASVRVMGPARVQAPGFDGSVLTLAPKGPLGANAHVEILDANKAVVLAADIPTENSEAPCR